MVQGLSFGDIRGPLTFPGGTYAVSVSVADSVTPCAGPVAFSGGITVVSGGTALGWVYVNPNKTVAARIFALTLANATPTQGLTYVANTTSENLTATFTASDTTASPVSVNFPPNSLSLTDHVNAGEFGVAVYPQGSTAIATGPVEINLVGRNVHLLVLAGSSANNSVQVFGPTMIRDVF